MLISAGCTFFLFLSFSQAAIIAWQCLFCGVSVAAWNGIQVITVELYPASKRYIKYMPHITHYIIHIILSRFVISTLQTMVLIVGLEIP